MIKLKRYLEKSTRDDWFEALSEEQRQFLTDRLKRSKQTHFANVLARHKADPDWKGEEGHDLDREMMSWVLIDIIDAGAVSDRLRCECGKKLRYQYVVENTMTGAIKRFGITHFQEHSGLPPRVVKDIVNGLQRIDYELDDILWKQHNGWTFPVSDKEMDQFTDVIREQLRLKLPLTDAQEQYVLTIRKGLQRKKEKDRPPLWEQVGVDEVQRALTTYVQSHGSVDLADLCEWLVETGVVSSERFQSGKPKIYPHIASWFDEGVARGEWIREGQLNEWVYRRNHA